MKIDLESIKLDQMQFFIKEIAPILSLDIPENCIIDFPSFKQLATVKMHRINTKLGLFNGK
jgi:hypothetical protein